MEKVMVWQENRSNALIQVPLALLSVNKAVLGLISTYISLLAWVGREGTEKRSTEPQEWKLRPTKHQALDQFELMHLG
jgi:hypothetical protein